VGDKEVDMAEDIEKKVDGAFPEKGSIVSDKGIRIHIEVRETDKRVTLEHMKEKLIAEWCRCEEPEFLCYPEDNQCPCGVVKHHVHCVCGRISQVG